MLMLAQYSSGFNNKRLLRPHSNKINLIIDYKEYQQLLEQYQNFFFIFFFHIFVKYQTQGVSMKTALELIMIVLLY
jgi:hypothetical protein